MKNFVLFSVTVIFLFGIMGCGQQQAPDPMEQANKEKRMDQQIEESIYNAE